MSDSTVVLSDEERTRQVNVTAFDAQVARLRSMLESERDADGPLWTMTEGRFPDSVGLPGRRYAHLYRVVDSAMEAFHLLAPRMLEEVAMFAFNLSIRESEFGQWICCLEANERVKP